LIFIYFARLFIPPLPFAANEDGRIEYTEDDLFDDCDDVDDAGEVNNGPVSLNGLESFGTILLFNIHLLDKGTKEKIVFLNFFFPFLFLLSKFYCYTNIFYIIYFV